MYSYSLIYFLMFFLGLAVGSFLNCVIYRFETGQGFLRGRSFCPHCKHKLSWQDLIPILSFLLLKGRCRCCQKRISWQYPLVEIATGLLFLLIFNHALAGQVSNFQNLFTLAYYLIIVSFLIIIFVYDLKHYIIPDKVIFPAIGMVLVYNFISDLYFNHLTIKPFNHSLLFSGILAAFIAAIFFFSIFLISKGHWLGFGDVKLAFFMGLFLGFPNILAGLFLSFFIGAIISVALVLLKKKTLKSEVPFGPFLVAGTFLALFWGKNLISFYLGFF